MNKIPTEPYSTTPFNYIFASLWENICLIEYIYQNFCFHHSLNLIFLLRQQVHHLWTICFPFSFPHMSLLLWCINHFHPSSTPFPSPFYHPFCYILNQAIIKEILSFFLLSSLTQFHFLTHLSILHSTFSSWDIFQSYPDNLSSYIQCIKSLLHIVLCSRHSSSKIF